MRMRLTALILGLTLAAGQAGAQTSAEPAPGAGSKGGRAVTATGQTRPPGAGAPMKSVNEAEMLKAQRAAAARDKAWDAKMRTTLGSICRGC